MGIGGVDCISTSIPKPNSLDMSVLAVDDNEDHRGFLAMLLEFYGITTQIAASGSEAFDLFLEFRPHLLVIDLAMPSIDGFGLLDSIRQTEARKGWAKTPAIAVTALALSTVHRKAQRIGYDALFPKPVDIDRFVAMIAHLTQD